MKQFKRTTFAAAAIIAALFMAACDNGTTTTTIVQGGKVIPGAVPGDAVVFQGIDNENSGAYLVKSDGTVNVPGTGYYTAQVIFASLLKTGAEDKIAVAGAAVDYVYQLIEVTEDGATATYVIVETAGELPAKTGSKYLPIGTAVGRAYTAASNAITVTGLSTGAVYALQEFTGNGSTKLVTTYAQATPVGTIPGVTDKKYIVGQNYGMPATAAGGELTATGTLEDQVYRLQEFTGDGSTELVTTYSIVEEDDGTIPVSGSATGKYLYFAVGTAITAASDVITTTSLTNDGVYALNEFTGNGSTELVITYAQATSTTTIPGVTGKKYIVGAAYGSYGVPLIGADSKITVSGAAINDLYALDEFTGNASTELVRTYVLATAANTVPAVTDKKYIAVPVEQYPGWYKF